MPKKNDYQWLPDMRGRYKRRIGYWIDAHGKRKQYPFDFGKNKEKARARLVRVRELWEHVREGKHQYELAYQGALGFVNREPDDNPVWDSESLRIAKQLAKGTVQFLAGASEAMPDSVHAQKVQSMAQRYPMITVIPCDAERYETGADFLRQVAENQLKILLQEYPFAISNHKREIAMEESGSLHDAFDTYIEDIKNKEIEVGIDSETPVLTPSGSQRLQVVSVLKSSHLDQPLSNLDLEGCQKMLDHWRHRPLTTDKRIEPPRHLKRRTCANRVKELMRFFKWVHQSSNYQWRKPEDLDLIKTKIKPLPLEKTSIRHLTERKQYIPDELVVIAKHVTPLERVLFLLGLNCGFRGAEQGTLLLDHLFFGEENGNHQSHPLADYLSQVAKFECKPDDSFIRYVRNKSQIYGEFLLWEQTTRMLRWAVERRDAIASETGLDERNILVTKFGKPFYRMNGSSKARSQIFANKWRALILRVQKNEPDFPKFSFATIRKTAADMIRQVSDGEVAATFLMHGQPVKSDELLDLYTKRPFARLFVALRQVENDLAPMFAAAPDDLFEQPIQQYTPLKKRKRIIELKTLGKTVGEIMSETELSRDTVCRTINKLYYKSNAGSL